MIEGVNLGNWLVLEKWMSPELFAGSDAEDETWLWRRLGAETTGARLEVHRDEWIHERDFIYLAVAWTYWSYKLHTEDRQHDPWDLGRAIELRWLPEDLAPPAG